MTRTQPAATRLLPLLGLLCACALDGGGGGRGLDGEGGIWRPEDGLDAERIELSVDSKGQPHEIEYHLPPHHVPDEVHAAMDLLYPGEAFAGEKEFEGSTMYWELSKMVDGRKVEALFDTDVRLRRLEIEVGAEAIPEEVRAAVAGRAYGLVNSWEEIRDGDRKMIEYHAKTARSGLNYKIIIDPAGEVTAVYREVVAEIELPVE